MKAPTPAIVIAVMGVSLLVQHCLLRKSRDAWKAAAVESAESCIRMAEMRGEFVFDAVARELDRRGHSNMWGIIFSEKDGKKSAVYGASNQFFMGPLSVEINRRSFDNASRL